MRYRANQESHSKHIDPFRIPRHFCCGSACTVKFQFDIAIVSRNSKGKLCRLIHSKNAWGYGKDQYVWNEIPDSHNIAQKVKRLKAEGLWLTVRDRYVDRKNTYLSRWLDKDHPSFIAYIETVNEIYYQYFKKK